MIKAIIFDFYGVLISTDDKNINTELLTYIKNSLKPKYKLGIVSNASGIQILDLLDEDDELLFDNVVVSGVFGKAKPEHEIYENSAEQLGVNTGECIFVDDIELFCTAAKEVGMQAIQYVDFEQTKTDLENLIMTSSNN